MNRILPVVALVGVVVFGCATPSPRPHNPYAPGHNARNSLDWPGTYEGVLERRNGTEVWARLTLRTDGRYMLEFAPVGLMSGEGRSFHGAFQWIGDGNRVRLPGVADTPTFFVTEGRVVHVDEAEETPDWSKAGSSTLQKVE